MSQPPHAPKLTALILARKDEWAIRLALHTAAIWCDHLIVALHNPHGLDPINQAIYQPYIESGQLTLYTDPRPNWDEMDMRQALLANARELDSTHLAIVDADEAPTAHALGDLREQALNLQPGQTLELPMISPYNGLDYARIDGHFGSARVTVAFADSPSLYWANAEDGYCYHARPPKGITTRVPFNGSSRYKALLHLQFASQRRLIAKAVYYKLIEISRWPTRMPAAQLNSKYDWTLAANPSMTEIYQSNWDYPSSGGQRIDGRSLIDLNEAPWQEAQAKAIIAELRATRPHLLQGLHLYGLDAGI